MMVFNSGPRNFERLRREPESLAKVIETVLESLEKSDLKKCGKIFLNWSGIVGDALAIHTKPGQIRNKRLIVRVDSSNWLYEIRKNLDRQILEKVQSAVGKETIEEIRYIVGEI